MNTESEVKPKPKGKSKHVVDSSASESDEDDSKSITDDERKEARRINDGTSLRNNHELPLNSQSRTENNAYLHAEKGKEKATEEIVPDPIASSSTSAQEDLLKTVKASESYIDKFLGTFFTSKPSTNVRVNIPHVDPKTIPEANPQQTLNNTEMFARDLLSNEELEHKRRLDNMHNELVEPSNRKESVLSSGFLLANNMDPLTTKIDVGMKVFVAGLDKNAQNMNIHIEKSDVLVEKWDKRLKSIEALLKSLEDVNWKKALTYGTIAITIIGFIYQCGMIGKLPNFAANVFSHIPTPNFSNVPKPKVTDESTLELIGKLMEKPVTFSPLNTLTGMGVIFGIVTLIKILRIVRK